MFLVAVRFSSYYWYIYDAVGYNLRSSKYDASLDTTYTLRSICLGDCYDTSASYTNGGDFKYKSVFGIGKALSKFEVYDFSTRQISKQSYPDSLLFYYAIDEDKGNILYD